MAEDLTPLGELLETARLAKRPKLSQNAVAKAADTSATTYRRIIRGVSRFGGQDVPFEGADETVARIADVLGVTPEQLEQVGRPGAAEELRASRPHARLSQVRIEAPAQPAEDEGEDPKIERAAELLAEAQALLEEIRRERREGA